jgi:putative ABC transport system permease protein
MKPLELLGMSLADLAVHKFRSSLATLGILFGVASVIAMLSIGEGARRETMTRMAMLGVDNIVVRSQKPPQTDEAAKDENRRYMIEYGLKRKDLDHLRSNFDGVRYVVGLRNTRQNLYTLDGRRLDLNVIATEPDYLHITRSTVARGRFLTDIDQRDCATACVVGAEAARKLFAFNDPLGRYIHIGRAWFCVVGVMENAQALKDAGGEDLNNQVFVPLSTARVRYGDASVTRGSGSSEAVRLELDGIAVQLQDDELVIPTAQHLQTYMKKTHPRGDYNMLVPMELLQQKAATQRIFTIVMASIAGISLLIGGIGIMNIMLANVYDRRKEIGMRRALGARRWDITVQFVLESATLTTLGGLVGIAVGYGLATAISRYAGWSTVMTPLGTVLSVGLATLVGIIFGFWPARQAARTRPIEALRSD